LHATDGVGADLCDGRFGSHGVRMAAPKLAATEGWRDGGVGKVAPFISLLQHGSVIHQNWPAILRAKRSPCRLCRRRCPPRDWIESPPRPVKRRRQWPA